MLCFSYFTAFFGTIIRVLPEDIFVTAYNLFYRKYKHRCYKYRLFLTVNYLNYRDHFVIVKNTIRLD